MVKYSFDIPQLVTTTHLFVTFPCALSNMSSCFFETLGAQHTVNTDVFGASEVKNHGIYDVLYHWKQNPGICNVFETSPSKSAGIYAIFSMLQEVVFFAKNTKTL